MNAHCPELEKLGITVTVGLPFQHLDLVVYSLNGT